jgi:superfamily I DNA/RNA helicase
VVAHNARRKEKHLFTSRGDGEKIRVFQAADERDEGRWIGSEIEKLHDSGTSYDTEGQRDRDSWGWPDRGNSGFGWGSYSG